MVAGALDWNTLRAEKDSFLAPELVQHPTDLPYAVKLLPLVRRRFGAAAERSQALLECIAEPAVLEELGEVLLDCVDGEAWLAALARRVQP